MTTTISVPARFNGPPGSGNGGYVAGLLAVLAGRRPGQAFTVSLRQPPPLDVEMLVEDTESGVRLTFGGAVIVQGHATDHEVVPVDGVSPQEALAASAGFPGHQAHPFPTCFSCGPLRAEGLRIFPGPARSGERIVQAATWTPTPDLAEPGDVRQDAEAARAWAEAGAVEQPGASRAGVAATWSALDCVGGWAGDLTTKTMVLGTMTAVVDQLPVIGEEHVLTGEHRGTAGRKTSTAATLYDADGRIVARAEHVWLEVDPEVFGRLGAVATSNGA